jgi:hypothetical protein
MLDAKGSSREFAASPPAASEFAVSSPASVFIGVCGEQAAGKSVFLTCVFRTFRAAFPDDVVVDYDRKVIGNASYFQDLEDYLMQSGPAAGTLPRVLKRLRLFVRPYQPPPGREDAQLTVDLLDYAGKHFRSMSDITHLSTSGEADPENATLREVNSVLETAHAFVILINSTEIDPLAETATRNPFSPSVETVLTHCREKRTPVALLFSQADRVPALTDALLETLPRVQEFKRQFTSDLAASTRGGKPFGIVRRISCYETVPGDLVPRRQTADGSIWLRDPADVVTTLLRAVMPAVRGRLADDEAEKRRKEEEAARQERWEKRRGWILGIAVGLAILAVVAFLYFAFAVGQERQQAQVIATAMTALQAGTIASLPSASTQSLREILLAYRSGGRAASSRLNSAIGQLDAALPDAVRQLAENPRLDAAYLREIQSLPDFVALFDPSTVASWWRPLAPRFEARADFLGNFLAPPPPRQDRRERRRLLGQQVARFRASGDTVFAALIARQATAEKEQDILGWDAAIKADAGVQARLVTIQRLLGSAVSEGDPEFSRMARRAAATYVVTSLLKPQENDFLRERLLKPLAPDLEKVDDGQVRFDVLLGKLSACSQPDACDERGRQVAAVLVEAERQASEWSASVQNVLRNLLLDIPVPERRDIWRTFAEALQASYLFSLRADAWPEGPQAVVPLPTRVLRAAATPGDLTPALIDHVGQIPVYDLELRYIIDTLTLTAARRRALPMYQALALSLASSSTDGYAQPVSALTEIQQSLPVPDNGASETLFDALRGELGDILGLVKVVSDQRTNGTDDSASLRRLDALVRNALRGHCAALDPKPERECTDAG